MNIKWAIHKRIRAYILWGIVASVLNIGVFSCLLYIGVEYKTANLYALLFNRLFCYVTNKLFVFKTRCKDIISLLREMVSFFISRLVSLFIDFIGVVVLVELFEVDQFKSKVVIAVVVVIINYLFSAFVVFKK